MDGSDEPAEQRYDRRRFLGAAAAAAAIGAAQLGIAGCTNPPTKTVGAVRVPAAAPGHSIPFGPVKQIKAGVLDIGYVEAARPAAAP